MNDYRNIVENEWENFAKKEHYPNIMLLGATGCGKSSLINTVFGKNIAYVSDTARGTTEFKMYHGNKDRTVNLIDSKGYEMGSSDSLNQYISKIHNWINSSEEIVHLVWYCIQTVNPRVQEYDVKVINALLDEPTLKNKIAIVATKGDQDDVEMSATEAIRDVIQQKIDYPLEVFSVSNCKDLKLDLEDMVEWSGEHIDDEDIKRMFIASQMVSLKAKRKKVSKIIATATMAAAATGAIPIPGPDAPILTTEQVVMSASIISCYGMNVTKGVVTSLVSDVLIANLGKMIAANIFKLIPGAGQIIGGAINASVAAAITAALGFAISEICYKSCKRIANGETVDLTNELDFDSIKNIMSTFLKQNRNKSPEDISKIITDEEGIDD